MGFDDQMTTILIAGGHTIGKNHGPCPADEVVDGKCKGGEGTFTTGFHGAWTTTPSTWSNLVSTYYIGCVVKMKNDVAYSYGLYKNISYSGILFSPLSITI